MDETLTNSLFIWCAHEIQTLLFILNEHIYNSSDRVQGNQSNKSKPNGNEIAKGTVESMVNVLAMHISQVYFANIAATEDRKSTSRVQTGTGDAEELLGVAALTELVTLMASFCPPAQCESTVQMK